MTNSLLAFIAVFSAVVLVHELGHFIAARRFGVKVYEFSIGFPFSPRLCTLFQHKVLGMLLRKGKIAEEVVKLIMSWRHSGFNVHCGPRIRPGDEEAMENLARYVIRASFSQERMTYIPDESKVVYKSKDGKSEKTFDALEWIAAMCFHVPNKGEQMVRYYG